MCQDSTGGTADGSTLPQHCATQLSQARLTGVRLAARELAHLLNNDLTPAVIVLARLRDCAELPADLQRLLVDATLCLDRAVQSVAQLQRVERVETRETPYGPALDLARSVGPRSNTEAL